MQLATLKKEKKMRKKYVSLQCLSVLEKGVKVDALDLIKEAEDLYLNVKAVGPEKTEVVFGEKVCKVKDIPIRMLAVVIHVMKLMGRWDQNNNRLEQHYGIEMRTEEILSDLKVFKNRHGSLDIITVDDFIDAVIKK